jgi:isopentenyl diphosphate isomerase/L-lactate dehydrogenase-like FMN-dependent dehydrogenase
LIAEVGVAHAITLPKEEIKRDLALLGRTDLSDLAELAVAPL